MTSMPIMYYALFDFEYEKDIPSDSENSMYRALYDPNGLYLMRNPLLFKIGMNDECLSVKKLIMWLFYALLHAMMIFLTCFIALN